MYSSIDLNKNNISEEIEKYLSKIDEISFIKKKSSIDFILQIKRDELNSGPYPNTSLFESANRIMSDLIILIGIYNLLKENQINRIQLPFDEYTAALGVTNGYDIQAANNNIKLIGEAFNVSKTFFQNKKSSSLKKLRRDEKADYKIILFNKDAVKNPEHYILKSRKDELYLPVDINLYLKNAVDENPLRPKKA
ncbi:MAG: hypothetical protein MUD12_15475 [Spirochaetes bacterium]|jgi:hypothetical protein|nr:hypothetical protein [Spirochaetota bacterium]